MVDTIKIAASLMFVFAMRCHNFHYIYRLASSRYKYALNEICAIIKLYD